SSSCPLRLRNRRSTDLLLSQRTDRCYEVFRNGSGKKGCTLHERQAKPHLHGGIPQRGLCSSGLLVLAQKPEGAWIRCQGHLTRIIPICVLRSCSGKTIGRSSDSFTTCPSPHAA